MDPSARTLPPGYRGPRTCTRCGREAKTHDTLVSLNPVSGDDNPDLCGSCVRLIYRIYQQERAFRLVQWTLKPIALIEKEMRS